MHSTYAFTIEFPFFETSREMKIGSSNREVREIEGKNCSLPKKWKLILPRIIGSFEEFHCIAFLSIEGASKENSLTFRYILLYQYTNSRLILGDSS